MPHGTELDHDATTRLVTSLSYMGAGEEAIADLQNRLDQLSGEDNRIVVGPIETNMYGQPVCGLSFNCDSYDAPIDGEPDPRAVKDLREVLGKIGYDGCVLWSAIEILTADSNGVSQPIGNTEAAPAHSTRP